MSQSLNYHMNMVMMQGINLLRSNEKQIIYECKKILDYLKNTHKRTAESFEFAYNYFLKFFQSEEQSLENIIEEIRSEWMKTFYRPPETHQLIYILTLLENAVHKAIKENNEPSFRQPSVQYLFAKIYEDLILISKKDNFHIDHFCHELVMSKQLQIDWVARIQHEEKGYRLKNVIGISEESIDPLLFKRIEPTWFWISESLLKITGENQSIKRDVFPVPWQNETLIFCIRDKDVSSIIPFLTYAMHLLEIVNEEHFGPNANQHWKDAVILFNDWIMRSKSLKEAIPNILYGYIQYLPFERCAFFYYSPDHQMGVGVYSYHFNYEEIQKLKVYVQQIPTLSKSLSKEAGSSDLSGHFQPIYIAEAADEIPAQYVERFQLKSLVVAPIYVPSEGKLIGGVILDQGPWKTFKLDRSTFSALLKFGRSSGELLSKFLNAFEWDLEQIELMKLSQREIDILQLLAEGASTTEAATLLNLSEYTVRDYISQLMKRLNAKNRTEAVVKAIRLGYIH
ncbi:response regulator transcription factor [Caldibacillus thermoamylovorans]|uniref:response regulator transcription factor n=1 Tax=Caldibacillus thermoamylovorans TaxID=35841 RepID=UPI00203DACA4|nr:response regulator transcription factor [Caldibacillus thermoamylovorans]MCM3798374.1 response regulator transcription factor [Caldibacillus thermoamylovorans]